MKLLVLSDSHGSQEKLESILLEHTEADAVVFLGDGARDMEDALYAYGDEIYRHCPPERITAVCGNCDRFSQNPVSAVREYGGLRFYMTHGHEEDVKLGLWSLAERAKKQGCNAALFGHTHMQHREERNGVILINPGSVMNGHYCILEVKEGKITDLILY